MADQISLYDPSEPRADNAGPRRRLAVEAALELIRADRLGGGSGLSLEHHMARVSDYADKIQEALEAGIKESAQGRSLGA